MTLFNIHINLYLLIALGIFVGVPIHLLIGKGMRWLTSAGLGLDEKDAAEIFGDHSDLAEKIIKGFWPFYLIMVIIFGAAMFIACLAIVIRKALKIWAKIIKFCWE